MAYGISLDRFPVDLVCSPGARTPARRKRNLLRRFFDALVAARQRQAEREIARFIESRGGFNDEVEREIERRFLFSPSGHL